MPTPYIRLSALAEARGVSTQTLERLAYRLGIELFDLGAGERRRTLAIRAEDEDRLARPVPPPTAPKPLPIRRTTRADAIAALRG